MFFYNNPYISANFTPRLPQHQGGDETIYDDHDDAYDYKLVDGVWQTRAKGSEGEWISLEDNEEATNKLNTAYPDALTTGEEDGEDEEDGEGEEDDGYVGPTGTLDTDAANQAIATQNAGFANPESGTILDTVGDNPFLSLIHAVGTTINSFKGENYYDPGSKEDYMKFSITNPTNEDLYVDPTQFKKTPNQPWKYLQDQEQAIESEFQNYLDDRHKRQPDKYGKVENFDSDLFEQTGHLEYKDGPKQGDLIEEQFPDATHLNWNIDKTGKYTTAHSYMEEGDPDSGATQFNVGDQTVQARQYPTPSVDTPSQDLSEDADNDGVPDYLTPTEKYGGSLRFLPRAKIGVELPKAQNSISDILLQNQDLSVLNLDQDDTSSGPIDYEGLIENLYWDESYDPFGKEVMKIDEINDWLEERNEWMKDNWEDYGHYKSYEDAYYPPIEGKGYPYIRNNWQLHDLMQEYQGEYLPQSINLDEEAGNMSILDYVNKDFESKGYQDRLRTEVRLNLEQIQGWDKLNSKQQEALIEKHFREIHAGRYEVARNTPFTYTVEDDPQTHGTRWGVNDNVTGFVALDEDTGDDTAIHEMYHVTTGANKGLTKRTFDLLWKAKNDLTGEDQVERPYYGDPTEVYARKKVSEDWLRQIGLWDSTSGEPYTKEIHKKVRKLINSGNAPDQVIEFYGDDRYIGEEKNRIIPEDMVIDIMNTVAFDDEMGDEEIGDDIDYAYAKRGKELPKAQTGWDLLQDHQIAAQLREKGIDPDATAGDLKQFDWDPELAELIGGFFPGLGEGIDLKNVYKSASEGDLSGVLTHGAGLALPFVPGKAITKGANWLKGWWRGADDVPYQKMFDDRTIPVRGGVHWDDGLGEYNSLVSMHNAYPDHVVKPGNLIMEDGVAIGYDMQNIPGQDLIEWMNKNDFTQEMYNDISDVITDLNAKGLYHGDLNASNIMIDNTGNWRIIDPVGFEHSSNMSEELLEKIKGLDVESLEDLKRMIKKYGGSLPRFQDTGELDANFLNYGECIGGGCKERGNVSFGASGFAGLEGDFTDMESTLAQLGLKSNIDLRNQTGFGVNLSGEGGVQDNLSNIAEGNINPNVFGGGRLNLGYVSPEQVYLNQDDSYATPYPGFNVGAYGEVDSNRGTSAGVTGGWGPLSISGGYNFDTKSPVVGGKLTFNLKKGGSLPKAISGINLDNYQSQGTIGSSTSGYNPSTNIPFSSNLTSPTFSNYSVPSNVDENATPPENQPFYDISDKLYASTQNVQRTQEKWDAFNADFNERLQNPSMSMLDTKTDILETPSLNQDLIDQTQRMSDMAYHREARLDNRTFTDESGAPQVVKSADEMQEQSEEFTETLNETLDNIPEYQGTDQAVEDLRESERLGFDSREEYLDFKQQQQEEEVVRDLRTDEIKDANKDNQPSFWDRAWNTKNRILDSKAGQTFSKIGAGAVKIAKPLNKILADREARKTKSNIMQNAYLSDNMVAATDSDISGSKGNYDANTGIFRPDDKVVAGTTGSASYGLELQNPFTSTEFWANYIPIEAQDIEIENIEVASIDPNSDTVLDQISRRTNPATERQMNKENVLQARVGGEAEIDMNTYKQLIAAGAQIEIL